MNRYRCPRCKAPLDIPEGRDEAVCPVCGHVMPRDELLPQRRYLTGTGRLAVLILLLATLAGVWLYIGLDAGARDTKSPQWNSLSIADEPRASNVTPRSFDLWELHPDDTVRLVNVDTYSYTGGLEARLAGPALRTGEQVIALEILGGELVDQATHEYEYRGKPFLWFEYTILASQNRPGYDMLLDNPPHLHTKRDGTPCPDRLISIGYDPQSYYAQHIVAITIPLDANVTRVYDYRPYRHVELEGWDIFYYDVTDIEWHVSIHINYIPGCNMTPLDYYAVEASR